MGSLRPVPALLAMVCGVFACAPSTGATLPSPITSPAHSPSDVGAPGIGDPGFPLDGNGGYDVAHYHLKLGYDPATDHLTGVATVQAEATQRLSRFNFDLAGLKVDRIAVNGAAARFARDGDELTVIPGEPLRRGDSFTATVSYSGRPAPIKDSGNLGTYGFIPTPDGAFVVCEPNGAKTWFPANDHPADKARFDFEVTVPAGLTVLANGEMTGTPRTSGGKTTYSWREQHPMATYLATITLGRFELRQGRTRAGVANLAAADPKFRSSLDGVYTLSAEITDHWSTVFGPYPFGSTGGVIDDFPTGYALENQTKPMYGGFAPETGVIAHELAHQWFGNSLSIRRWKDLWLNEGFATYAEWLWGEHKGKASAESVFKTYYGRPATDPMWSYPPGNAQSKDLFNQSIYIRGAMTLHALRRRVGDETFFRLLKEWTSAHEYGNVTTDQFVALAEKLSARRLGPLFDAWLFQPRRPAEW
ncbi:M1 family metallopeptidase [Nonomuraea sp. NPDC046570]|uniref:M1 family metallopeptidase n=1 Tax=Nonomuraea sp. NPDC046570 TaxID=3155255 RepID=UPI0033FD46E0